MRIYDRTLKEVDEFAIAISGVNRLFEPLLPENILGFNPKDGEFLVPGRKFYNRDFYVVESLGNHYVRRLDNSVIYRIDDQGLATYPNHHPDWDIVGRLPPMVDPANIQQGKFYFNYDGELLFIQRRQQNLLGILNMETMQRHHVYVDECNFEVNYHLRCEAGMRLCEPGVHSAIKLYECGTLTFTEFDKETILYRTAFRSLEPPILKGTAFHYMESANRGNTLQIPKEFPDHPSLLVRWGTMLRNNYSNGLPQLSEFWEEMKWEN